MATIHIDEIKAIARRAHGDEKACEELFDAVFGGERDAAVNAAWALTHLPREDNGRIAAHREKLTRLALATKDVSLRRITLTLLERLDWTTAADEVPDYYMQLLDFCFEKMMSISEPYGVRSLCMKLAYKISQSYPELVDEVRQSLLLLEPSDLGSGVRCTRSKILSKCSSSGTGTKQC